MSEAESELSVRPSVVAASVCAPEANALAQVLSLLQRAERPLLIANRFGADPMAVAALVSAAEKHGFGVLTPDDFYMSFPSLHSHHLGFHQGEALKDADLVIALDCEVPWYPLEKGPRDSAPVVHVGPDPLAEALPLRSHRGDIFLRANARLFVEALVTAKSSTTLARQAWLSKMKPAASKPAAGSESLSAASVSSVLSEFLNEETVLINELGLVPENLRATHPGTYFRSGSASPLGWGVGCALGLGLGLGMANTSQTTIACVGDGVFLLSPVLGALFTATEQKIPLVVVVLNNGGLRSIAAATNSFYKLGTPELPLTQMAGMKFERVAEFVDGFGARATTSGELHQALRAAIAFTHKEKRPAIIEAVI